MQMYSYQGLTTYFFRRTAAGSGYFGRTDGFLGRTAIFLGWDYRSTNGFFIFIPWMDQKLRTTKRTHP
jgi:hypothetical protein